jgi:hypothetical protein
MRQALGESPNSPRHLETAAFHALRCDRLPGDQEVDALPGAGRGEDALELCDSSPHRVGTFAASVSARFTAGPSVLRIDAYPRHSWRRSRALFPRLFVMWDSKIKKGRWEYGDFLLRMHSLAVRIRDELAPEKARDDIDGYLQRTHGHPVRKPLATYIDEYNWWLAWEVGRSDDGRNT